MCKASHFSTQENKPKIVSDEQGNEIGIEKNAYWEIAILPNTDFIISGDNIPDGTITTNNRLIKISPNGLSTLASSLNIIPTIAPIIIANNNIKVDL